MKTTPFGFRVVGHKTAKRRAIRHCDAFAGYADCDPRAEIDREAFLSHFTFDRAFVDYLEREGSEAGYSGPCAAPWLWLDVDRPGALEAALSDSRRLCGCILERFTDLGEDDLLIFLSGGKGCHVGIPVVWHPEPSPTFNAVAKRFCADLADAAGVAIDGTVYSKTRLFRAPNSRHPSGLYKRRLSLEELMHLKPSAAVKLAERPEPFEIPCGPPSCPRAAEDWSKARRAVESRENHRAANRTGEAKLSAFARRYIRDGELDAQQREVSTFRVAAELSEVYLSAGFGGLLHAVLEETALDSGLAPSEVKHAIDGGIAHAQRQREGGAA